MSENSKKGFIDCLAYLLWSIKGIIVICLPLAVGYMIYQENQHKAIRDLIFPIIFAVIVTLVSVSLLFIVLPIVVFFGGLGIVVAGLMESFPFMPHHIHTPCVMRLLFVVVGIVLIVVAIRMGGDTEMLGGSGTGGGGG